MKALLIFVALCFAQEELTPTGPAKEFFHFEEAESHSGLLNHDGNQADETVFKKLLTSTDAIWMRVQFMDATHLGEGVTMKITSTHDGYFQILNQESLEQWDYKSAFFNGDTVVVEVWAGMEAHDISIDIRGMISGENPPVEERDEKTLCFNYDNRQRDATRMKDCRFSFGGSCSAWLINDAHGCVLTAGHCGASGGTLLFNVPDSTAGGGAQMPPPEKQYSTQSTSIQGVNGGVGNDWRVMAAFRNSNTGLAPRVAQGASYALRTNSSQPGGGTTWQHFGHGSASGRMNLVLKGSRGSLSSISGSSARYRISTTGGDSGSAVSFPGTGGDAVDGQAVVIHSHGGCTASGGANAGTWIFNNGLQNALRNPRGICATGY